jgi:hypothetical protein
LLTIGEGNYTPQTKTAESRHNHKEMNLSARTLFKLILYLLCGLMSFMASVFLAQHHMLFPTTNHCEQVNAKATTKNEIEASFRLRKEEPTQKIITPQQQAVQKVECRKRQKTSNTETKSHGSRSKCHPNNAENNDKKIFVDFSFDILKYRLGDDKKASDKQTKITNNKASLDPKSMEPITLTEDEAITGPRVLNEVFWQYHHPSSPLTSEILLRIRSSSIATNKERETETETEREKGQSHKKKHNQISIGEFDLHESKPYKDCDKVFLTRTGSLANMPNKCLAVTMVDENYITMRHPPRLEEKKTKTQSKELLQFIPYYRRLGKVAGNIDQYARDYTDSNAYVTEATLLPGVVQHLERLKKDFVKAVGFPPVQKLADGTEKR